MAKLKLEFEGFDEVVSRLTKLDGNVIQTTEKALKESHDHVTPKLHQAMSRHYLTGDTEGAIVENAKVEWVGRVASVSVGFNIKHGGLPSIFLMYGTPRMSKDSKLYNAIYGARVQKEIREIQEDIFYDEIRRLNG